MKLGEKIKQLRISNNMTQDELAKKCYVTRTAVSKWENDNGLPNLESLILISECFNISIDKLLKDDDDNQDKIINNIVEEEHLEIKKRQYILSIIIIILYTLTQLGLRELLCYYDPTAILSWGMVIAPILAMLLAILSCLCMRNYKKALLNGIIAFIITIICDFFIIKFNYILYNLVIYIIYVLMLLITYSLKYGRLMLIPNFIKKQINKIVEIKISIKLTNKIRFIISLIILMLTIILFLILLFISIYWRIKSKYITICNLNFTPLTIICLFIVPLALEIVWVKVKYNNYKKKINK